jgi:response regulator RpfG family c-di-GMP phosphodiesterase
MSYKILIVDDEPANLRILERLFRSDYKVVTASSGIEAIELLGQHDIALIISDQRMPVMTGIDFLKKAAEMRQHTVRIIITGYTDVNALVEAINSGVVYKYVTKPWINEDLQQTVKRALQHHEIIKSQHQLWQQTDRLQSRLKTTIENFVNLTAKMLELKKPNLYEHVRRTNGYAVSIGQSLNLGDEDLEQLSRAALLHEAAHVNVPNDILFKKSGRTAEDEQIFKEYFLSDLQVLASVPDLEEAASIIRSMHEQFGGGGYPDNLTGEQIPLKSRILAVADAFDEMIFSHDSGQILTANEAITELQSAAGKKFDPDVVEAFSRLNSDGQLQKTKALGESG